MAILEILFVFVVLPGFVGWGSCKLFRPQTALVQTGYAVIGALAPGVILLLMSTSADPITAAATIYVVPAIVMLCLIPAAIGCLIASPSQKR